MSNSMLRGLFALALLLASCSRTAPESTATRPAGAPDDVGGAATGQATRSDAVEPGRTMALTTGPDASGGAPLRPEDDPPAVDGQELQDWFGQAGDRALITVAFTPMASWEATSLLLMDSVPRRKESLPIFGRFRLARTWADALAEAMSLAGVEGWPQEWPGLDTRRPVLLALFAPVDPMERASQWLAAAYGARQGVAGMRHDLLVPASSAGLLFETLVKAVGARFERVGVEESTVLGDRPGALFKTDSGGMAILPAPDHVRISLLENDLHPGESKAARNERLKAWLELPPAELTRTPALDFVLSSKAPLRVYVRPARLRAAAMQIGLAQTTMALAHVGGGDRSALMTGAASILGRTWAFLAPASLLYEDIGVSLEAEDAFDIRGIASHTAAGARVQQAAGKVIAPVIPASAVPAYFTAGINVASMVAALPASPLVSGPLVDAEAKQDLAVNILETYRECGLSCSLHLLLGGWPVLASVNRAMTESRLPSSLVGVVRSVSLEEGKLQIEAALALSMPEKADTEWLHQVAGMVGQATGWKVRVKEEPLGGRMLVLWSVNAEIEDLLRLQESPRHEGEVRLSMRTAVLADIVRYFNPYVAGWMGKLGQLTLVHTGDDRAARFRLVQAPGGRDLVQREASFDPNLPWRPAVALPGADARSACLNGASFELASSLSRAESVPPEAVARYYREMAVALDEAQACAGDDGAAELIRLKRFVYLLAADRSLASLESSQAAQFLKLACEAGHEGACSRERRLTQMPALALPMALAACPTTTVALDDGLLVLMPDGLWQASRHRLPLAADSFEPEALREVAKELAQETVSLAVDGRVAYGPLLQLLNAFRQAGAAKAGILFRRGDGPLGLLEVQLGYAAEATPPVLILEKDLLRVKPDKESEALTFDWSTSTLPAVAANVVSGLRGRTGLPVHLTWSPEVTWENAGALATGLACGLPEHSLALYMGSPVLTPRPLERPAPVRDVQLEKSQEESETIEAQTSLMRLLPRLRKCYKQEVESTPGFTADLFLDVGFGADGRTTSVSLTGVKASSPGFDACVKARAEQMRLPRGRADRSIRIPVRYGP